MSDKQCGVSSAARAYTDQVQTSCDPCGYPFHDRDSWGLCDYPLAMVYAPIQAFRGIYDPCAALHRGTMFCELDLPLKAAENGKAGGCGCGRREKHNCGCDCNTRPLRSDSCGCGQNAGTVECRGNSQDNGRGNSQANGHGNSQANGQGTCCGCGHGNRHQEGYCHE